MKCIPILLATLFYANCFGQKTFTSKKDISDAKEIIFYGYDFSHFKLADARRLTDERVKDYLPAWVGYLIKEMDERYFARKLKTSKVIFDFQYTGKIIQKLDENDIVSLTKNSISPDSIQSFVDNYQISQKEGIGFTVIVECFDKEKHTTSAYFTFFDISTKQIIMSDYFTTNNPSGTGLTKYWGKGFLDTVDVYISAEFRYSLRRK